MRHPILLAVAAFHVAAVFTPPARAQLDAKEIAGGLLGVVAGAAVASIPALVYLPFRDKDAPEWTHDEGMMITLGVSVGAAIVLIPFGSASGIHLFGGRTGSFRAAHKGSWLGLPLGLLPCGPFSLPLGPPVYGTWFYERSKRQGAASYMGQRLDGIAAGESGLGSTGGVSVSDSAGAAAHGK